MATHETPGAEPPSVWLCHSLRDHQRALVLERCLVQAGFAVRGPQSLAAGAVRADEEARALRAARWVVVLGCVELLTDDGWRAQEVLLRAHPRVVVAHLRPSQLRLEGAAVLDVDDEELAARVVLRLQGSAAPAWRSYAEWLRRRHGRLTLWHLPEEGAQGAGDAALAALYVPPVLKLASGKTQAEPKELAPMDLLAQEARCLLVRGEPGLGKSTLLRYLALQALERPGVMPLWVSAAAAPRDGALAVHLERELAAVDRQWRWLLRDALATGDALLLVDGLDEVESEARQALVTALQRLQAQHPRVQAVLTTRPAATVHVANAEVFDVQRFEPRRIQALWERLGAVTAQPRPAFRERWHDWNTQIQALAEVPLLLGLLRQVATGQRPLRGRVEVYNAVVRLFLESWSLLRSDQPQPQRSSEVLEGALSRVALAMHEAAKESLPAAGFKRQLAAALPVGADTRLLLEHAMGLGLLKREGGDHLAFQHATFREYLAAQALLADDEEWRRHLPELREDPRWREVLYVAVAQRGMLEDNGADADRLLREVLDGPPTRLRDVLLGPLCVVAELLHEGVGASRALATEVLRRLRESLWLEVPAVDQVLYRLSEDPELPWDEAWLAVHSRGDYGLAAALPKITTWLAARSTRAREICQTGLNKGDGLKGSWSPELAALGLARGGDRSAQVLRALEGWHHLDGERLLYSANPNDGLVSRRIASALVEAARRPKASTWATGLLDELRRQLVGGEPQSRLGAAWLLADAGLYEKEVDSALWDGSWDCELSPAARERSRRTLAQFAEEWPACVEALLARWRGLPTGPDEVMDWLTALLLLRTGAHRVEVIERLLDVFQGEDDARQEWARRMLERNRLEAGDKQLRQALWARISRPGERRPSERWRLFRLVHWDTEEQVAALRTFLTPDCPLEVRIRAAEQVAERKLCALDEMAIRALSASFAVASQSWVPYYVKKITERSPTLQATFERQVKDGLAELPEGRRFTAAQYLYEGSQISREEWLAIGACDLALAEGAYRLRLISDLAGHAEPESLSLALLPLLDGDQPKVGEVRQLLRRLRPESAEVLSAFLYKLAPGSVSLGTKLMVLDGLAAMLWRRPELVTVTLEHPDQEEINPISIQLLRIALQSGDEAEDSEARAGVAQVRETLRALLGQQPPRRAWNIVRIAGTWGADSSVREVLLCCLEAEELAAERVEIADELRQVFHEDALLLAVLRAQCRSANATERVEAARLLMHEGHLSPLEHALLAAVLRLSDAPELVLMAAGLLIEGDAEDSLKEQAGFALHLHLHLHLHQETHSGPFFCDEKLREQFRLAVSPTIAEWAAVLLFLLPAFHARLAEALLSWLRPASGVRWTGCGEALLRALSLSADQVAPPILERITTGEGRGSVASFGLGLDLGVPAPRILPALLVALLRSPKKARADLLGFDARHLPARPRAQLELFGWWWHRGEITDLHSLLSALYEQDDAAAELRIALEAACEEVSHLDEDTQRWVRFVQLFLSGATAQDYDLLLATRRDYYDKHLAALAAARDGRFRQWLVLAATAPSHEDTGRMYLLEILREAERLTPASARAEIQAVCSTWLAEDDPAMRLWALDELRYLGWIEPAHLQPLLELLEGPIGTGWYADEASFRGLCGELILNHFPKHAAALHGPLLAVLPDMRDWSYEASIPALLAQAECPRAPLIAGIRAFLGRGAQRQGLLDSQLGIIRSFLVANGLFAELAEDFADLALIRINGFGKYDLDYIVGDEEITLEPDPQAGRYRRDPLGWPDKQRLKHVPAQLAGALARRLGGTEDVIQALWTAIGQKDDSYVGAFQQVVQRAASDPVLRPFAVALVDRWGTD